MRRLAGARRWRTATVLRCFYADHAGAVWSVPDLAEALEVDPRTVERAHALLRRLGLLEEREHDLELPHLKAQLPPRRFSRRGVPAPLLSSLSCQAVPALSVGPTDHTADPAHARGETAPRPPAPVPERGNRRNHGNHGNRGNHAGRRNEEGVRRRRPRGRQRPPPELGIGRDLLAALEARHGRHGAAAALAVMREAGTRAHAAAALLAARTLAERDARSPGALYRHLFRQAVAGDVLVDRALEADRVRAAEAAELAKGADLADLESRLSAVRVSGGDPDQAARLEAEIARLRRELGRPPPEVPKRTRVAPASSKQEACDFDDPVTIAAALESIATLLRSKRDACK